MSPSLPFCIMTGEKYETDLKVINSPISNLYDLTHSKCFSTMLLESSIVQKLVFEKSYIHHCPNITRKPSFLLISHFRLVTIELWIGVYYTRPFDRTFLLQV